MSLTQKPCIVGTWPFSRSVVRKGMMCLLEGGTSIDAVEIGINMAEKDPNYGPYHVGCGGWQNADGILELDAAIMDGKELNFGAVTALKGFPPAISVARRVMEKSRHNMLTGEGAIQFARTQGFVPQDNLGRAARSLTSASSENKNKRYQKGHDTLGLIALDRQGNICAGVSTSGMCGKEPGRVGDSALPGCGLYADSLAGAACCSGDGDEILKYCPSYKAVDLMKQGFRPCDACLATVKEIVSRRGCSDSFEMVIIAMDKQGRTGAANVGVRYFHDEVTGEIFPGFPYVVMGEDMEEAEVKSVQPF